MFKGKVVILELVINKIRLINSSNTSIASITNSRIVRLIGRIEVNRNQRFWNNKNNKIKSKELFRENKICKIK